MEALYTWTLLGALAAGGLAMAAVVLGLIRLQDLSRRGGWRQVMRLRALATLFAAATVIALAVSIGVHAVYDHGPTSRDPMSPLTFVLEHPQFLFPLALAILALLFLPERLD